ncbi:MAG: MFS transporter, partial [Mesorhizobium sp.]
IYTMSIIELGERFTGSALVAGNAAFSLMWGVGGIAVPPLAGGAMDMIGANGLPITLGAICLALALTTVLRGRAV